MVSHAAFHFTEKRMTRHPQNFMDVQNMTQAREHGVLQTRRRITHGAMIIGTGVDKICKKNLCLLENYFYIPIAILGYINTF